MPDNNADAGAHEATSEGTRPKGHRRGNAGGPDESQSILPRSAGPYDVAMLIATSFGRLLPAIAALLLLIAILGALIYGAWASLDKITTLQSSLIGAIKEQTKAEIAAAQAKADSKAAADTARYEALQDYSKKLAELNTFSADFSKRLQDLVSGQVENMKKTEELTHLQNAKSSEYQAALEKKLQSDLNVLQQQIAETQRKGTEQRLQDYRELKQRIAKALRDGQSVQSGVLDLLQQKLSDPEQRKQAIEDSQREDEPWEARIVLLLELLRQSPEESYASLITTLLEKKASDANSAVASLFSPRLGSADRSANRSEVLLPMVARLISNSKFGPEFRDGLLSSGQFIKYNDTDQNPARLLSQEAISSVVKYSASRLYEAMTEKESMCWRAAFYLNPINALSREAELVSGFRATQRHGASEAMIRCVNDELAKNGAIVKPDTEALGRWSE